jgi:hypothetical protein
MTGHIQCTGGVHMSTATEMAVSRRVAQLLALPLFMIMLAACTANVTYQGLRPVYPAYPDTYQWDYAKPYDRVVKEVESLQPNLEWESFPRQRYLSTNAGKRFEQISNVTYELRIFGEASELVYERAGLIAPHHRIETPLQPSSRYHWSVRARFDFEGQSRVTQWSEMALDLHSSDFAPRKLPYPFKTPEAK